MSRNGIYFTVEEVLAHLDGDFDIPDEGVNSDFEWLEDEDFEEGELILPADSVVLPEEEEEEINLWTVQIEETDDSKEEVAKERPSNVTVEEFSWSDNRAEIDIPGFLQAVGPMTILPVGALALDFFLLFMSSRILQNILRETNWYASQTLQAKNTDPTTWKQLSMEELKAFFGLLVAMSIHKLPCLRDYWSSNWVLSVSAFSRVMPLNRFLDIWNNVHLSDNTKMPKPGNSNFDKLFKVRQFIDDLKTNFWNKLCPPPWASFRWGYDKI